ncbi:MAG TPA: DEAD/DEAH box helicase, partial [Dehalococcoidia bacterium]|nr:DEAD/DEAH box helicase [Dehalococcoidia bacterium]
MTITATTLSNPDKVSSRPALTLRPYQEEALQAIATAAQEGIQRQLVALPTGSGKTIIFTNLIDQRGGRSLILAHRDELLRQAADKLLMVNPGLDIGIVKAALNEVNAPVVVASVQTLSRANRLSQLSCDFNTVVVDEAHHGVADSYQRILNHVGSLSEGGPLTVGFTATPERADKMGLGDVWQAVVYQRTILEMMLAGYLCDLRAIQVRLQIDLDQLHVRHGDFVDSELGDAMTQANAPQHVVSAYLEHAADRKSLIFTPTVKMAHDMSAAFQAEGIRAEALDGTTPDDERRAMLHRLHTGETMVLANCLVLTEGFDS